MARHRKAEPADSEFRLLFVCTGNICRSPLAEILTRHLLIGRLGGRAAGRFDVSSAGVQAVVGSAMHPDSQAELAPWGLHRAAAGFTAQQLRPSIAASAHLVLGVSPEHRSAVVECAPAVLATTFSLGEFARLVTSIDRSGLPAEPVVRAHALVEAAWMNRGLTPPVDPVDDLVPDPIGRPREAHQEAAALIVTAVRRIVDVIAPPLTAAAGVADAPAATTVRAGLRRQ